MVIDLRCCNGCKLCTTACQTAHYLQGDQTWIVTGHGHDLGDLSEGT